MKRERFNKCFRPLIECGAYKVVTKDGHSVRIIAWDRKFGDVPIVALVDYGLAEEIVLYRDNGVAFGDDSTCPHCIYVEDVSKSFYQ